MLKVNFCLAILIFSLCGTLGEVASSTDTSGCLSPVFIDKPKTFDECGPKVRFYCQVAQNYEKTFEKLESRKDDCKGYDLSEFRSLLTNMRVNIHNVIDTYFNSKKTDPTDDILRAFDEYNLTRKRLTKFGRCAPLRFPDKCNALIQRARQLPYSSAENILTSLMRCSSLKSQAKTTSKRPFAPRPVAGDNSNCLTIGVRPDSQSKLECYSDAFITKLHNFIDEKFGPLYGLYDRTSDQCDYSGLLGPIRNLQALMHDEVNLLRSGEVTFAQFDAIFNKTATVRDTYSLNIRNYILENHDSCYMNPRTSRQLPLFMNDAIYSILVECIRYTDKSEDRCGAYDK